METEIAEDFRSSGLPARASCEKYLQLSKPDSVISPQNLLESARKDSFEIMLALKLGDTKEGTKGVATYSPLGTWGSRTARVTVTNIESQLLDVRTGDLLYTVDTESEMDTNDDTKATAKSLSSILINEFIEGGALVKSTGSKH